MYKIIYIAMKLRVTYKNMIYAFNVHKIRYINFLTIQRLGLFIVTLIVFKGDSNVM